MGIRIGADVGGTFTDFVVHDQTTGRLREFKVPSTATAPEAAVVEGFRRILAGGVGAADVALFAHGTTVALNTLLQRSGAVVGLLVTEGFRDVLQLRRLRVEGAPGFNIRQPSPLVRRRHVGEIGGRLLASGQEVRPLDLEGAVEAARALLEGGCEAIAISLLHSYRNREHEVRAAAAIQARFPDLHLTLSSEVWPQQREYERTQVAVINAHVAPAMRRYFGSLTSSLRELGIEASVLSTKSSGGVMSAARAAVRPVETLLSGPASGVVAAAHLGRAAGLERLVAFDMGGTSADVGLVEAGGIRISTESTVGDFPVLMPSVDVSSIGAGGGSIARLDPSGVLKVGPTSAGSDPGPACYGRGGQEPTVTDAYATLGVLTELLGGEMPLDLEAARASCGRLGRALRMTAEEAAEAILEVATSNMYARLLPLMAQRGADPREYALLPYGGAGPTHAFRLAAEVGFSRVVVPPSPGTFCAMGCLLADLRADFIATVYADLEAVPEEEIGDTFAGIRDQARRWAAEEAVAGVPLVGLSADMRYAGQSHEIPVDLGGDLGPGLAARIRAAFEAAYEAVYGSADRAGRVELVNARAHVIVATPKPPGEWSPSPAPEAAGRRVLHAGRWVEARVMARQALPPGRRLAGPVVITQYDTTTFVPPGASVEVDGAGNLVGGFDDE